MAIAWQAYRLRNSPSALAAIGLAWTLPMLVVVLLGWWWSCWRGSSVIRVPRRRLMLLADVVRAAAIATMGALVLAGVVRLWHLVALAALYGCGEALFGPAFSATCPTSFSPMSWSWRTRSRSS